MRQCEESIGQGKAATEDTQTRDAWTAVEGTMDLQMHGGQMLRADIM